TGAELWGLRKRGALMETSAAAQRVLSPQSSVSSPFDGVAGRRKWATLRRYAENRLAVMGAVGIVLLYALALAAPWISRYPYDQIQSGMRDNPPSAEHWLGTDRNGRDVYSRLVKGGQVSLAAGFASVVIIMTVGVVLGAAAGFFGGLIDGGIM